MRDHFARTCLGDLNVQRNVRSRFRLHPRFADPEVSHLIESVIKSARKLVVEPPMTVDLNSCAASVTVADLACVPFSLFFGGHGGMLRVRGSPADLLSISHVLLLTELTAFSFSQRDNLTCRLNKKNPGTGSQEPPRHAQWSAPAAPPQSFCSLHHGVRVRNV